jgi:RNA polymerase sigma-70 factor, ECF subfamily
MDRDARATLEADIRQLADEGDTNGAMTIALRGYGPELLGFLTGLARDRDEADELFGALCEKLWRALANFRWDSTFRVWAYASARNEFLNARRFAHNKQKVPLDSRPEVEALVQQVRSTTPPYQRTDVKDAFAELRATLDPDDQMLLGLRVDRDLAWPEVASILGAEAPALRKRYERLTKRLREMARERGIVE